MPTYTVRPSNSEKEAFRIKLTATSLLALKIKIGDVVLLQLANDDGRTPRPAVAWENSGAGMKDTVVQISKYLQDLYSIKLGDKVGITRSSELLKDASTVILKPNNPITSNEERAKWIVRLSASLHTKYDILTASQKLSIEVGHEKETFEAVDVGGLLVRATKDMRIILDGSDNVDLKLDFHGIGGLQNQISVIKQRVQELLDPEIKKYWSQYIPKHGLLLYGAKGTGKTFLKTAISRAGWADVVRWSPGVKVATLVQPRLITVSLSDIRNDRKAVSELIALFESIQDTLTLVVGEARHPNDVDESLRTIRTFAIELEIPIPDTEQRLDILRALRGTDVQPSDEQLQDLAARTHAFVGADLVEAVEEVWRATLGRCKNQSLHTQLNGLTITEDTNSTGADDITVSITQPDIEHALTQIRPTALQEVFLEKPSVYWSDIGGQQALIERLKFAVVTPLHEESRQRMKLLGVTASKGVLLYGPPGCSKTLLVKALATEASLNFLAVKGAELISMYVGESERATREVFRKARAAAPAIIFFDEIDAIASRGRAGSDLNVLTTLLNEMDGFEELHGVLVVAATNKPQSIDPALLRPGRFDNVVYVGLPDLETRKEIFEKRLRNISVAQGARDNIADYAFKTDGLSGAEVVAVCKTAGETAFHKGRDYIGADDFEEAISITPRGVTKETLDEYERWNESRRRA